MKLRALIIFVVSVLLGSIVFPFAMWAYAGFPDEGSHGLWIPVMTALTLGLPIGAGVGILLALVSFLFPSKFARAETQMREAMKRESNQSVRRQDPQLGLSDFKR